MYSTILRLFEIIPLFLLSKGKGKGVPTTGHEGPEGE